MEKVGQSITLGDIDLPKNVEFAHEGGKDTALATISHLQKTLAVEDAEAAEAAGEEEDVELDEDGNSIETEDGADGENDETTDDTNGEESTKKETPTE